MKKISSEYTFFYKKLIPVVWLAFLGFALTLGFKAGAIEKNPMTLVSPGIVTVIGYFIWKKKFWTLADEVYDWGDFLMVKNNGQEEQVLLTNIMNVSASTFTNPPRVTLKLVNPGKFGTEISFLPVRKFFAMPFANNAVSEDLIIRVDRARGHRVA